MLAGSCVSTHSLLRAGWLLRSACFHAMPRRRLLVAAHPDVVGTDVSGGHGLHGGRVEALQQMMASSAQHPVPLCWQPRPPHSPHCAGQQAAMPCDPGMPPTSAQMARWMSLGDPEWIPRSCVDAHMLEPMAAARRIVSFIIVVVCFIIVGWSAAGAARAGNGREGRAGRAAQGRPHNAPAPTPPTTRTCPRERCAARRACGQRERPPRAPRVGMALRGTQTLRGARRALLGRARGVRPG